MSGPSTALTGAGSDLMNELRTFITGATKTARRGHLDLRLARTALALLKTLPASRDAVLEYFCSLFDEVVARYVVSLEKQGSHKNHEREAALAAQDEATIVEVHNVLCDFVSNSPEAWAPIISTWSLQLLGQLSSRYADRAVHRPGGLNESLQLWMSCRATRTLIDITTQCLKCLMHSDTESCINALLDTCVAHSPYFDWVVAHVGSCFPKTVMTRVLSCGLKDFCCNQQGPKAPKLNSVVGILSHLAGSHSTDMRRALLQLFQWSLETPAHSDPVTSHQRFSTVPFLLQLANMSPTLLRALSVDVLHTLSPEIFCRLSVPAADWLTYCGGREAFQDLLVHLVMGCPTSGPTILALLLNCAAPTQDSKLPSSPQELTVQVNSQEFLELLLQELSLLVHRSEKSIPLLGSLRQELNCVLPLLLSPMRLRVQTALRLIGHIGHQSPSVFPSSVAYLLLNATNEEHLGALVRLIGIQTSVTGALRSSGRGGVSLERPNTLQHALEQALHQGDDKPAPTQLWRNLSALLKWEHAGKLWNHSRPVLRAVYGNMGEACSALSCSGDPELAHAVADTLILALKNEPEESSALVAPPSVQTALRLAHAAVSYFFSCLEYDDLRGIEGCHLACQLLCRLSLRCTAARSLALRTLLEGALFHGPIHLLGAIEEPRLEDDTPEEAEVRLMNENLKQGLSWVLAQRHSSVFHAGVIGSGLRRTARPNKTPSSLIQRNTQLFVDAIRACCVSSAYVDSQMSDPTLPTLSMDAVISVSLLLVELISPDVMYNGLPWPDEDNCKATVERDCHIRRKLEELPLLWELLWVVAINRPALCYCSVLLRAVTATLIAQWGSCSQQRNPTLLPTTTRLLSILALGQLLPSPLSSLTDIVSHLKPSEVVQILRDCVWNYMRDHVPSPALFTRDSTGNMWRDSTQDAPGPQYTETMRLIMLANIHSLGELYAQLFNR